MARHQQRIVRNLKNVFQKGICVRRSILPMPSSKRLICKRESTVLSPMHGIQCLCIVSIEFPRANITFLKSGILSIPGGWIGNTRL